MVNQESFPRSESGVGWGGQFEASQLSRPTTECVLTNNTRGVCEEGCQLCSKQMLAWVASDLYCNPTQIDAFSQEWLGSSALFSEPHLPFIVFCFTASFAKIKFPFWVQIQVLAVWLNIFLEMIGKERRTLQTVVLPGFLVQPRRKRVVFRIVCQLFVMQACRYRISSRWFFGFSITCPFLRKPFWPWRSFPFSRSGQVKMASSLSSSDSECIRLVFCAWDFCLLPLKTNRET